ncbi:MAG: hypothetical protein CMJ25_27185 [Phycisphaerae bacterium]|nr:hypothetical protein [Phycisphaerae bacterium]|tara:strand:- start:398 stop:751 length:354 start_codon:yes stop_codon:yes gene_type:complete
MAYNYTPITKSAEALITRFGEEFTFTRTTDGAYNPATGSVAQTTATYKKYACVFDYTDADRAGQTVLQGDRRMLAEGHSYEINDTVVIGSDIFKVINVDEIRPNGSDIVAANLQVRK